MMTGYSSSKLAVKDSFDDDEASDEVEDEVFIRDGRNGFKVDEERGVKRPLMAPRRKHKNNYTETCKKPFYKRFCIPYCYGMIAVALIIGFVVAGTLLLKMSPASLYNFKLWTLGVNKAKLNIIPCTDYTVNDVWFKTFPWLKSEVALVLVDVNQDDIDDIIIGYATDQEPGYCEQFINAKDVCGGGVLALDGKNGETLWQHWTRKDVLFVDCSADITSDKIRDCLISGKGGVLSALNGKNGNYIWGGNTILRPDVMDLYAAQYVSDLDGDGSPDVLVAHTLSRSGQLSVLSGKTGKTLGRLDTPDKEPMYTVPRVMVSRDGSDVVLFVTGSYESSGSLFATLLINIAVHGPKHVSNIWKSDSGVTSGIVLADMNGDGTEDIILTCSDTLTVLDGNNYTSLWNISSSGFEKDQKQILIGPTPAYFNDDLIPDLLITQMIGPSFPTLYYSETWVANGKDGLGLLEEPIIGSSEITAPGVAISFTGIGNDMFLFWTTTCNTKQQQKKPFLFSKQSDIHDNSRADLCHLRFNKTLEIQMYALNQHIEPPGILLYSSKLKWEIEHNVTEHKTNRKVKQSKNRNKDKLRKHQEIDKIYQEVPKYPLYDGDDRILVAQRYPEPVEIPESRDPLSNIMAPVAESDYDPAYPQEMDTEDIRRLNSRRGDLERDERRGFPLDKTQGWRTEDNYSSNKREKRKADHKNGLPRATTTAALSKPINGQGIDIVFATHWIMPAQNVRILTERDQRCIRKKVSKEQTNNLNNMDQIEEIAEDECLGTSENDDEDYDGVDGQLTIYKTNLGCKCSEINPISETCSTPLPLERQSYSHRATNVYFKQRHRNNFPV